LLLTGCHARPVTVAAAGDLQLSPSVSDPVPLGLLDADVKICNLESAITTRGGEALEAHPVRFAAPPERAEALRGRVDAVSLANNHALDQGEPARDDTVRALASVGVGAAWDGRAAVIERNGRRVILLAKAFAPSADLDAESALVDETLRRASDGAVLVSVEWGHTGSLLPTAAQRRLGKRLIDAGASAVLGHGPHTLQGVERRGHGVIAYSLGNLAFACGCTDVADAYQLRFTLDGRRASSVRILPLDAGLKGPAARSHDAGLLELIENLSRDLGSSVKRDGDTILVD
jgi:poly-gamma-glutamate synthesis protein (capsule biosynthesis protein)